MSIRRAGLTLAVVLLACVSAAGQPPVAPPPHPALDGLVAEYRRLGLPIPPAQADLVHYRRWPFGPPEGEILSYLGFRILPTEPGSPPRYLTGTWFRDGIDPDSVVTVAPTPATLQKTYLVDQVLPLASQGRIRGWNDLSAELYARARESGMESERTPLQSLRDEALAYWQYSLTEPKSDWKAAHKYLRLLAEADEKYQTGRDGALLYSLEAALFYKRTAPPGTPKALIDDLIDYWEDPLDRDNTTGQTAYWKLAALGFDAVPALLDHLHDDRLTRTFSMELGVNHAHHVTVGLLCSRLVYLLSARQADAEFWDARGDYLDSERAAAWHAAARAGGEEKWLVEHALPASGGGGIVNHPLSPEKVIVRALAAKYPARLPALYRTALRGPIADSLQDFVPEIVASRLPRAEVAALLTEGAEHPQFLHRYNALQGLEKVAPPLFRKHVRLTLEGGKKEWPVGRLAGLVVRAGDESCWDALAVGVSRMSAGDRCDVAFQLGHVVPSERPDRHRRQRLRILLSLLDDSDPTPDQETTVRDFVAAQLAGMLGLPVTRDRETHYVYADPELGPLSRFARLNMARHIAAQELAAQERRP